MRTLPEAFQATRAAWPDAAALVDFDTGDSYTWEQYGLAVERIAQGMAALAVSAGDCVGLLLANRPEFHLVDTAALHLGAAPFSIYTTLPPEEMRFICDNAEVVVLVTERRFMPLVRRIGLGAVRVICVDGAEPGAMSLEQLMRLRKRGFDFERSWQGVHPGDLATITYTSGTTGPPKGVELTHSNVLAQLAGLEEQLPVDFQDSIVSYLPAAHIADRVTAHYGGLVHGLRVTSVSDPHRVGEALARVRPTVVFGVPRVWQKARAAILDELEAATPSVKARIARWALDVAAARAHRELRSRKVGYALRVRHRLAEALVLRRLRLRMGLDRVRFAATGAAPISLEILQFFYGLGVPITEVWGLTEATGVSTTTTLPHPAMGTVGKPLRGVELRLAPDGEIQVRGSMVMRGYHRDAHRTQLAADVNGWLQTGDIGHFDRAGNLHVVGRKSEMIINDTGKNIAPAKVENAVIAASFLIGQVMVVGEGRPYLAALITLDTEAIAADATANGVTAAEVDLLVTRPGIRAKITEAVIRGNATVSRPEQIRRFVLLDHTWEPGGPEVTPKMSLRRNVIARRYAPMIDSLYSDSPGPEVIELRDPGNRSSASV
ncbi:AMP-dependent synthetase/ligase [Nocardia takedensis]|uniref:AMP-dependent synthetase/ligase n=1 Tax=Nocardia takedensis TaxID=259390 RepID=UPI001FDFED2E|nr:AMP-dependent synthetase/ligase [Nocardia takedensis]